MSPLLFRFAALSIVIVASSGCGEPRILADSNPQVVISADGRTLVVRQNNANRTLLTVDKLPKKSELAPDFEHENVKFLLAQFSPKGSSVAFLVDGTHQWVGIIDPNARSTEGNVRELDFLFEARGTDLVWSPTSFHFALELVPASGLRTIRVYDTAHSKLVVALAREDFKLWPAEAFNPRWTGDGSTLQYDLREVNDSAKTETRTYLLPRWQK